MNIGIIVDQVRHYNHPFNRLPKSPTHISKIVILIGQPGVLLQCGSVNVTVMVTVDGLEFFSDIL